MRSVARRCPALGAASPPEPTCPSAPPGCLALSRPDRTWRAVSPRGQGRRVGSRRRWSRPGSGSEWSSRSGPGPGAGAVDAGDEAGLDQGAPQTFGVTEPRSTSPTAAGSGPGLDAGSGPVPGRGRVGMRHGLRRRPGHHGPRKRSRAGHRPTPGTGDGEASPGRPSGDGRAGRDTGDGRPGRRADRRRPSGTGQRRRPTGTADRRRPTCGLLHLPALSPLRPPASTARSPRRPSRRRRACAGAGRGAGRRTARSRRPAPRSAPVASRRGPARSAPWSRRRRGSPAPLPRRRRRARASSRPVAAPRRRRGRQGSPRSGRRGRDRTRRRGGRSARSAVRERAGALGRTTPPHGETGPRPGRQPVTEGLRRIRVWRHGIHGGRSPAPRRPCRSTTTAKLGPVHLTGNAPSNSQARSRLPPGPTSVIAAVERASLLPAAANCSPDDLFSHCSRLSFWVMPRFSVMLGQVIRPGSLCTKLFWPPSSTSSTPTSTSRPLDLHEPADLDAVDLEEERRGRDPLAVEVVIGHRCTASQARSFMSATESDQSSPVGVLEVEQRVEIPVEVVRQVGDLVPQRRPPGTASRRSAYATWRDLLDRGCRAARRRRHGRRDRSVVRTMDGLGRGSTRVVEPVGVGLRRRRRTACSASTSAGSPKLMMP